MKKIADETADMFDHYREVLGEKAQEAGYVSDLFRLAGSECERLPDDPILSGAIRSFTNFRDYAKRKEEPILSIQNFSGTAYTVVSSASAWILFEESPLSERIGEATARLRDDLLKF